MAMEAAAVGGAAAWLFGYNRENFMFDGKQIIEREYMSQEFKIKQFELYREDVKDLFDLTVSKMENYIVIGTLMFGFCVLLLTEGRPKPGAAQPWMHWLYSVTTAGSLMYFTLSIYLAVHASVSAHAFGVRLLVQYVRLPVPNLKQVDAARARARDYEGQSAARLLRVPVLRQQLRRLNARLSNENFVTEAQAASDVQSEGSGVSNPATPASSSSQAAHGQVEIPSALLKHVQLYRELQANWQAFDAYSRVAMAMGTNQLLQALGYFSMCVLIAENHAPGAALSCVALFAMGQWLLIRLDLYLSPNTLRIAGVLLLLPPLLSVYSIVAEKKYEPEWEKTIEWATIPAAFFMHIVWILFMIYAAQADTIDGCSLPTKFRSVLYLDVYGWLSSAGEQEMRQAASEERLPVGSSRRNRLSRALSTVTEEPLTSSMTGDSTGRGSVGDSVRNSFGARVSSPTMSHQASASMQKSLATSFKRTAQRLGRDIDRWRSDAAEAFLEPDTKAKVEQVRVGYENALKLMPPEVGDLLEPGITSMAADEAIVWLRATWNSGTGPMDFYFRPDTRETSWQYPEEQGIRVCTIPDLEEMLGDLEKKGKVLVDVVANAAMDAELSSRGLSGSLRADSSSQAHLAAQAASRDSLAAPTQNPQVTQYGGSEATAINPQSQMLGTTAAANASFHPQQSGDSRRHADVDARYPSRPPGLMPWHTFLQGSLVLVALWTVGFIWAVLKIFINLDLPLTPSSPDGFDILSEVSLSAQPAARKPELVYAGPWPHAFFNPKAIACHPALGSVVLVAETYAVYAVNLGDPALRTQERRPAGDIEVKTVLTDCLSQAPEFQARGFRDISLECEEPPEAEQGLLSRPRCVASLLAEGGHEMLRCPLRLEDLDPANEATIVAGNTSASASQLHGGPWSALAADGSYTWGTSQSRSAAVQLQRQEERTASVAGAAPAWSPLAEKAFPAAANVTQLQLHRGGQEQRWLLALERRRGRLHAQPLSRRKSVGLQWLLPASVRWQGMCATSEALFFVGRVSLERSVRIWTSKLPPQLRGVPEDFSRTPAKGGRGTLRLMASNALAWALS
eukprot:TRINITY_DN18467_c0_g1_i1.p1 TRINITY_DN18467_c0_g1~~TRINITY_DN18467_c0_g1_i1.p1  ORF type:complete len:1078 (-),score=243.48 TRINITY_DN18467_c0_g1_i1:101-3334(-)